MKIDKASLFQPKQSRRLTLDPSRGAQESHHSPSPQASTRRVKADHNSGHSPSVHTHWLSRWSLQPGSVAVFITLLVLGFGLGVLITRLSLSSPSSTSVALSPIPPPPITPSLPPPSTATATFLEDGDLLETLYIDIMPADYEKIIAKRREALQIGILLATGADYVPGTIRLGHEEIQVELRLKGDWADHFAHGKWSFRVRTLGEGFVLGMRVFSLQDPSTRSFLNEWLFLENLRQEDVLAPGYHFVHVVLNGEYKGIYALEEGFSKELFESQERREGLIIRYDEDLVWEYRAFYDDQLIPWGINQVHLIDEFQTGQIQANPALLAQRDTAVGMLRAVWTGERSAADVFDLTTTGRFLALTDFWSAPHGLIWHNLRYYYNPITARLEPIGFDSDALTGELDMAGLPSGAFYHDRRLQAAYARELWRISQPGYVEALQAELSTSFEALRTVLEPEFGPKVLAPPWDMLRRRQELLRQTLNPYQTVYAYVQRPSPEHPASILSVDVGNLLDLPLEVIGLTVDDTFVPSRSDWVAQESADL